MEINNFGKIGVLMGGPSSEREISLKSGKAVLDNLKLIGMDVIGVDIKTDNIEDNINSLKSFNLNCAFIALHGRFGEDGKIQKILDRLKIPYTGSGPKASGLAMDKLDSHEIFKANHLDVPDYKMLDKKTLRLDPTILDSAFHLPLVIKPVTGGSSIGLSIVTKEADLKDALELAFGYDERVIVEEYIKGRELTVGILDGLALPVIEIIPKKQFFDFEAKYQAGMAEYIVPAKLNDDIQKKVQDVGLSAHKLLGCYGCSRADIILSENDIPFVLEVNTIPGFTLSSLLPKAAKAAGIDFPRLCLKLLELGIRRQDRN
ncbi:MAG: D-alanine--D-alanine ligase [Candidatus Omnitrophota bacterium]|nr:D-alanine--D-alanine ligase [Candidatus Omnitrophota bacterium]MBU1929521.1 D-alanine--D-alanine ligase [Candidatus Omnitrophota bacterium]MBU2035808.1 D-alanine--D-alanine ligase [Candidatus Omnitrophota bacterium]MBU2221790.1 D-alanine--D-alanine ligase [Candidatus Omnitrophota bacterium]MBU2258249.1 D-alanine--D-alanine ligase [Candidatus Omnitrophota bacterium]